MTENVFPMITVIAPCLNEVRFIEDNLRSILQGDYPHNRMELLAVDGMSTDGTRQIIQKMAEQDSRLKLLDNPGKIQAIGMNIGIKAARGEYIVRIDCHADYASDYVSKCIEVAMRTKAQCVGGYTKTLPFSQTKTANAIMAANTSKFGVGNSEYRSTGDEREVDTVQFGTFPKKLFEEIGLYDSRLVRNEDTELNARIHRQGGRIVVSPEIKFNYYSRGTFRGLWKQGFNNGLWHPYTIWLIGYGPGIKHFIPMCFVLGLSVFAVGAFLWLPIVGVFAGYLSLYLLTAGLFALARASKSKISAFLGLWAYVVLHLSYGLGTLWAILTIPFKFPRRHKQVDEEPVTVGRS